MSIGPGKKSSFSSTINCMATPVCLRPFLHCTRSAFFFALPNAGSNMLARMPMMAMTTRSSIRVKAVSARRRMDS